MPPYYTVNQAASALGLRPITVRNLLLEGIIAGERDGDRGNWRIHSAEVARVANVLRMIRERAS